MQAALHDRDFIATAAAIAGLLKGALCDRGGKALIAGNGGSAAQAQHLAAELVGRFDGERAPLPAVALSADSAVVTALANDYGFNWSFARQVAALGRAGDVFVAISTSGNSPNILAAADAARGLGLAVVGLTGRDGGALAQRCDLCLKAPALWAPLVQQLHLAAGHAICALIELGISHD